jgi:hypothetical protein
MRKKWWNGILIVSGLLFSLPAFSQQRWERNYGGAGDDWGESVQQTSDGGYIVAGTTRSFGNAWQVYLVKTNAFGDTLWTRNYGGADYDWGHSVQQTSDGGYIVAGFTAFFMTNCDLYLIKTNVSGDTLWTRNYGGVDDEEGYSVKQTSDGGYIIAGYTASFGNWYQVYLVKTNAFGDTLWTRNYGGAGDDRGYSVQQTTDGGYIVAGYTDSFGNGSQVYLIKTNASGDTLWTRVYGGGSWSDWGESVQQTSDGGYIIAGEYDYAGDAQIYLIKTNASGDTLWTKTYGGADGELGYSVQQTSDGGYIVSGLTCSFISNDQVYLVKTDASGDTLWTKSYGGTGIDDGYSVQQTTDGGYIVAGGTSSFGDTLGDVYLIKTDTNGNVGVEDNSPGRIKPLTSNLSFSVIPNPFSSFASVPRHSSERFALYDISGRKVGIYKGDRIGLGLSAGIYFLKPENKNAQPLRIVKLR